MIFAKRLAEIVNYLRSHRSSLPTSDEQEIRMVRAWLMVYASDDIERGASLTNEDLAALIGGPVPRSAKVTGTVSAISWLEKMMPKLAKP